MTNRARLSGQTSFNLNEPPPHFNFTAGLGSSKFQHGADKVSVKVGGEVALVSGRAGGEVRGGGRHFPPAEVTSRGSKSAFCLSACVCSPSQGQARGESRPRRKSMAPPSLRASQTLSTVTTASVGNNAVGARDDYLNCAHRLLFVCFFCFFQTNAQHSGSQQSIQQFLIVVRSLCNARTFSLVKQDHVCFIRKFLTHQRPRRCWPTACFQC